MRQLRTIALALAVAAALAPLTAQASKVEDYCRAAGWKLGHGLLSLPYSVVDVFSTPGAMASNWDIDGRSGVGFSFGIVFGLINANARFDQGVAEIITFPFVSVANPRPFKFEPFVTGWRPIMGRASARDYPRRITPRSTSRPSGD